MHLIKDENGNVIQHGHEGHHDECPHGNDGHSCQQCKTDRECKNESVALLTYMVQHNEHHAQELDQMADSLDKLGIGDAAKTIREGVSDFQKANMRFSLALAQLKEQVKEA